MAMRILTDERGQGLTEYAILSGVLTLGAILALLAMGSKLTAIFTGFQGKLNNVPTT